MKILKNVSAYFATMAAVASLAIPLMAPVAVNAQSTSSNFCYTFSQNLGEGRYLSSQDAAALTTALTNAGVWSGGAITTYNDSVASAVSGFQEKYTSQILAPYGLSYGTGFVGASTRSELNSLYGCSTPTQPVLSTQCPAGFTCTPIGQAPVCPAGWTCTPTTPTQPTNPINNPQPVSNGNVPIISGLSGKAGVFTAGNANYVSGQYFSTVNSAYLASVNNPGKTAAQLNYTVQNDYEINLTLPSNPSVPDGQYYLYLVNNSGTSVSFLVTVSSAQVNTCQMGVLCGQASITSITPTSGTSNQSITITGSGFMPNSIVEFSENGKLSFTLSGSNLIQSETSNQITFIIANVFAATAGPGTYQVMVSNDNGNTTSNALSFTLTTQSSASNVPVISSLSGKAGTLTTGSNSNYISGQYFSTVNSAYLVSVNSPGKMAASLGYTVQNDSEISLVLPTNPQVPSGQYYLYLVNNSGTSVSFPVTVSALPSANVPIISGLSGKSAVFTTGPNNYISGQYFTTVNSAYLASVSSPGKMAASLGFVVQDDSDINLTLPTNPQVPIGQYYLYLANSAGTSQSFTVTVANPGI